MVDQDVHEAIGRLPCWAGAVDIEPLAGGITNRNFRVRDHGEHSFVVRIGHDIPEHGLMRFNELAAARAAHAAGIAPEVVYAANGFVVSRFIDGATLTPSQVRDAGMLERIVRLLRRCHQDVPRHFQGPALIFWVFQVVRNYLGLLAARGGDPKVINLTGLAAKSERLEQAVGPVTIVFGHNDLLAANLIDDGARLWLIDWDYAGFNSPLFDLANLASNNELPAELETVLLESYFGAPADAALRHRFAAMRAASLLREALWGAVSHLTSTLAFDYVEYSRDYQRRFERSWREFETPRA